MKGQRWVRKIHESKAMHEIHNALNRIEASLKEVLSNQRLLQRLTAFEALLQEIKDGQARTDMTAEEEAALLEQLKQKAANVQALANPPSS